MGGVITTHDWTKWASIFGEDGGFEIYETTTKTYASNEIYSVIGGPARHMLETREVLDDIKTRFFELDELTFGFTPQKDKYLMLWVQNWKKMTGQIRKTAAKDALKQLQNEGLVFTGEAADEVQAWDLGTA